MVRKVPLRALVALVTLALAGSLSHCGGDDDDDEPPVASGGSGGAGQGGTGSGGSGGSAGGGKTGCERFEYVVTRGDCRQTGCGPVTCPCEPFSASLTACTDDGCLTGANCAEVCAADFGEAFECSDQAYMVRDGGAGAGGSAGAGGAGGGGSGLCTDDAMCPSMRCNNEPGKNGVCIAGQVGELCAEADDCAPNPCDARTCTDWLPATVRRYGGPFAHLAGFALDATGHALLVGNFVGVAGFERPDFGTGPLETGVDAFENVFVARYAPGGVTNLWAKGFSVTSAVTPAPPGESVAVAAATNASGAVFVVGTLSRTIDFGGGPLTSVGGYDLVVAKFSAEGGHLWSRRYGGANPERPVSVAADAQGDLVVIGTFDGASNLGAGPLAVRGGLDVFLAKFAGADGTPVWSASLGGTRDDRPGAVSVDAQGNALFTVNFRDNVNLGAGQVSGDGAALVKYSPAGVHVWSKPFAAGLGFRLRAAAADAAGNVAVAGESNVPVDLGGGALPVDGTDFNTDLVLAEFSSAGQFLWSRSYGGPGSEQAARLAVDAEGRLLVLGVANGGQTNLGGFTYPYNSGTDRDIFVALYGPAGEHLRSRKYLGAAPDDPVGVVAREGQWWVAADISNGLDLGQGAASQGSSALFTFANPLQRRSQPCCTAPGRRSAHCGVAQYASLACLGQGPFAAVVVGTVSRRRAPPAAGGAAPRARGLGAPLISGAGAWSSRR